MKKYLVGGAVRDMLMGLEPKDRDYVVVGETEESMLAAGFTKVGADFPVFLDPETKEEYALARKERSTGPGYHDFETDFSPEVTLEEDLLRRDLTINAIAYDEETGQYIDPYGGVEDIKAKRLAAVNNNAFLEDPLRIYRLARLFARYGGGFEIPTRTLWQVTAAVKAGGLNHLPKERKFSEIKKCFSDYSRQNKPSLMVVFLADIGELPEIAALEKVPQPPEHHPEGDAFVHTGLVIDAACHMGAQDKEIFAAMLHDVGKAPVFEEYGVLHGHEEAGVPLVHEICDRFGVPESWRKLAAVCTENHGRVHKIKEMKPKKVLALLEKVKAEQSFDTLLSLCLVCQADAWGRGPTRFGTKYDQGFYLMEIAGALSESRKELKEKNKEIALRWKGEPSKIAELVKAEKLKVVKRKIGEMK
ncbi:Poly A polymerase [Serratia phage vB_SmaM-ChuuTotoro]|nr:Poly A polymerase [Serratia phage vB_SmaM-ChuuTotoro]